MSERSHRDDRLIKHLLKENMKYREAVDKLDYDVKYWKQQTLNAEQELKDRKEL